MLKKVTTILSVAFVIGALTGPADALSLPGMKHHVTGNVTAVNPEAKTFTVTDDKSQKTFNFDVKDRAMLSGVKNGEHVRVAYSKHGTQLTASSIVPKTTASKATTTRKASSSTY